MAVLQEWEDPLRKQKGDCLVNALAMKSPLLVVITAMLRQIKIKRQINVSIPRSERSLQGAKHPELAGWKMRLKTKLLPVAEFDAL